MVAHSDRLLAASRAAVRVGRKAASRVGRMAETMVDKRDEMSGSYMAASRAGRSVRMLDLTGWMKVDGMVDLSDA